MSYAFANNPKLEILEVGDKFSTESATDLSYMFYRSPLVPIPFDKIKTNSATNLAGLFQEHPLTAEDFNTIRTWNTSNVTSLNNIF